MLKAAIVGCGKIADDHASQIGRIKGCEIVGVCDREPLMARQLYERFPVKRYFGDLTELLSEAKPDVVHITTPPQSHFDIAKACLQWGCHVYLEKPFTLDAEEAGRLIALATEKGLKITAGHDHQFTHVARRMRSIIQSGFLGGPPVHMESYYCYELGRSEYVRALLGDKQHWVRRLPGKVTLGALAGWALNEPQDAERVPNVLLWAALPFVVIFLRTGWRAVRALRATNDDHPAATVGLIRPRVVISPRIVQVLDAAVLAAALAHERAHARHRDPLRLWLAQIATDLSWPWPAATRRLLSWKQALEFARDDEARLAGVAGPDLAAAIVAALRLTRAEAPSAVATLGANEAFVKRRIERLLRPLDPPLAQPRWDASRTLVPVVLGIGLAMLAGTVFGEEVVRMFFAAVA